MKTIFSAIIFVFLVGCACNSDRTEEKNKTEPARVLIFSKTEGFRHNSIPDGINAINKLTTENDFTVAATEDASQFSDENLQSFEAVIFLNTTGDILNDNQQQALQNFILNGGGFMGIHSATDTEYEWEWYGRMIGAYFKSHPQIQSAKLQVLQKGHPATSHLPDVWTRTDEWYNLRDIQPYINPLINLDESTYEGGENGENHPVAWFHEFEGGRVFYTSGGHTKESYTDTLFTQHLLGGMQYVTGQ